MWRRGPLTRLSVRRTRTLQGFWIVFGCVEAGFGRLEVQAHFRSQENDTRADETEDAKSRVLRNLNQRVVAADLYHAIAGDQDRHHFAEEFVTETCCT